MAIISILFPKIDTSGKSKLVEEPAYFKDLNLDQVVDNIIGKKEYLKPFFYTTINDIHTILYRQEIMRDLECEDLFNRIYNFASNIQLAVRRISSICEHLAQSDGYYCNYVEKGSLLDAAKTYCDEINNLIDDIPLFRLNSHGFLQFMEYIIGYSKSEGFLTLLSETNSLKEDLSSVKYCMLIKGNCIKVRKYEEEIDYTSEIEETFKKFQQGAVKDFRNKNLDKSYTEHVEAGVLNLVAKLYPEIFSKLDEYSIKNKDFLDETIVLFTKEVQFYIEYLNYISKFKSVGLRFCYPTLKNSKDIYNFDGFDLALANNLINKKLPIVCNDFYLNGNERIIVVSGPNQGGKTTFARAFGQIQHLACIGCPVPGREAELFMFDHMFTHFEKEEDIKTLNGKLQDELVRMQNILYNATSNSIIIINEILASTALKDAISIGREIMSEIARLDLICVCVTFIDELASLSEKNVSMVSTVVPEDPTCRTYKILRSPADGLAYAMHIAEKYRVTYQCLKERIK